MPLVGCGGGFCHAANVENTNGVKETLLILPLLFISCRWYAGAFGRMGRSGWIPLQLKIPLVPVAPEALSPDVQEASSLVMAVAWDMVSLYKGWHGDSTQTSWWASLKTLAVKSLNSSCLTIGRSSVGKLRTCSTEKACHRHACLGGEYSQLYLRHRTSRMLPCVGQSHVPQLLRQLAIWMHLSHWPASWLIVDCRVVLPWVWWWCWSVAVFSAVSRGSSIVSGVSCCCCCMMKADKGMSLRMTTRIHGCMSQLGWLSQGHQGKLVGQELSLSRCHWLPPFQLGQGWICVLMMSSYTEYAACGWVLAISASLWMLPICSLWSLHSYTRKVLVLEVILNAASHLSWCLLQCLLTVPLLWGGEALLQ